MVPKIFSLVDAPEEALRFFQELEGVARRKKPVFVDLQHVRQLTPDAILYTLARVRTYAEQGVHFSGNAPEDETCRELWVHSGFYETVLGYRVNAPENSKILSIRSGVKAHSGIAGEVIEFAAARLGLSAIDDLSPAYVALVECITNTYHHASRRFDRPRPWSLIARHDETTGQVQFAILDTGRGIPATVRSAGFGETLGRVVGHTKHHELIRSTLEAGVLRTRSGKSHRGRGLPKIYSFAKEGQIQGLRVLSRSGYVDCQGGDDRELPSGLVFRGTLLAWSFVKVGA